MDWENTLRTAFDEIKERFPFRDYIGPSVHEEMAAIVRELAKVFPEGFAGKRLLDIGCGPMDKTGVLQRMGFACSAADDLSDPWHRRGDTISRITGYARDLGIEFFHQADGRHDLPFPPGSFDVVLLLGVVEHLHESPRSLLNAAGAFLKPGGVVVVEMPNSVNLRKRLSVLMGRSSLPPVDQFYHAIGPWRGHVREYTLDETAFICRENGFEIFTATTFEAFATEKLRPPLRQIYLWLGRLVPSFRSMVLVVGRKPATWAPVKEDPEAFRRAFSHGVPSGAA
jgi:SAM-dependent methyltransferase